MNWRLPTINELISLIDYTQHNLALPKGHPFEDVQSSYYWSGSTYANYTYVAWLVHMGNGYVYDYTKSYDYYVWPVRDGKSVTICDMKINYELMGMSFGQEIAEYLGEYRFHVLWDSIGGVLDNATGLIWAKQPSSEPMTWDEAVKYCEELNK